MARTFKEFEWPPSDPLSETERFRDLREALQEAATPRDAVTRSERRKQQTWRRVIQAVGLTQSREGS